MNNKRTHYITTNDGVNIGGTVHGHGPALIFLHGIIGDGDLDFQALLPHLASRFTCHLPSNRGRGLSGNHSDLSSGRMADDILTYIDSLEQPTGLVGWSAGADLALLVASQTNAVDALAVYEPVLPPLMDEQALAAFGETFARMGKLANEGRLADAMRAFARLPFNDDDLATAESAGYLETAGRYVPTLLGTIQQQPEYRGPSPDDPAVLGAIQGPVMVLQGSDTKPFMNRSVRHVAEHVPGSHIREIPGAGHAASLTHPEALSEALTEFFSPVLQPA